MAISMHLLFDCCSNITFFYDLKSRLYRLVRTRKSCIVVYTFLLGIVADLVLLQFEENDLNIREINVRVNRSTFGYL